MKSFCSLFRPIQDFCAQAVRTLTPDSKKTSISNLDLNIQSECSIQQGRRRRRRWTTLERARLPIFGRTCKGLLTALSVQRSSPHVVCSSQSREKVAVVNPDWQGHYRIPPHTSNEYGYSQTSLWARAHTLAHANLRRFGPLFLSTDMADGTCGAASCSHHAGDSSTATKARQRRVPAHISTDETF